MDRGNSNIAVGTLILLLLIQGVSNIRITNMIIPEAVLTGAAADLECEWDLEHDILYSVKWYREGNEFYRYTPTDPDPVQIFNQTTHDTDREHSDGGRVRITNVTMSAAGTYHCEVSGDAPTFKTDTSNATVTVVDPPDGPPEIEGAASHFLPDDSVELSCISRRSNPAPNLAFFLNSDLAPRYMLRPQVDKTDHNNLTTSTLTLKFDLSPELLHDGQAVIKCHSEIPGAYEDETEEVLSTTQRFLASFHNGGGAASPHPHECHTTVMVLVALLLAIGIHTHR